MKRLALMLAPLALVACQDAVEPPSNSTPAGTAPLLNVTPSQAAERVVPGRIVARLRQDADETAVASAYGLAVEGHGLRDAFVLLRGAVGNERALAARLRGDDRVIYAEPDYLREPTAVDPRLWAFDNPGGLQIYFTTGRNKGKPVTSFVSLADADEDNVDDGYAADGTDVVIGSIDTGVDFTHSEFAPGQLVKGTDWYSGDSDPSDTDGHGTHTTGTMAGRTVGVAGVSGAGPHVTVYVQRVCGPLGCPTSAIANAIREAADVPGMVAMNLSLGGSSESSAEKNAIAYAVNTKGVLVIASAGNGGTGTVSCPACDPLAISVAASNWQDQLAYYSNWGSGLDVTAPGGQMYSNTTEESGIYSAYLGGGYAYLQGTSMAAPQVTGTAGIVASMTDLRGAQLRARIEGSVDDLGASGYDTQFGWGRLNSYRAVTGTVPGGGGSGGGGGTLTASFTYSCGGSATCSFDASGSTGATIWNWNFGDGSNGSGETTSHMFDAAGTYTVRLTVGDGSGGSDTTTQTVSCSVKGKRLRCG